MRTEKQKEYHRNWQKADREKYPEKYKTYQKIRREKRGQLDTEWQREYFRNNPTKRLLWTARNRAKQKELEFSIDESDIIIPTHCPYLGIELLLRATRGTPRTSVASLDRIDSSKGYIKGNVEVISWLANTMKSNATTNQLVMFAQKVLERHERVVVGCRMHDVEQGPSS